MCHEKKEEKDSATLEIASMHRYEDYIIKFAGRLLTVTGNNRDNTSINRKDNQRKTIKIEWQLLYKHYSNKLVKSHTRKLRRDWEKEALKEKQNIFWVQYKTEHKN